MESTQKLPCVLWREVLELLGKLTDHGKAEDCRTDPKPGVEWEPRVGCGSAVPARPRLGSVSGAGVLEVRKKH